jgi:hypothetical protein
MSRSKIRIVFSSGHVENITCDSFSLHKDSGSALLEIHYPNSKPKIMFLKLADISAVLKLK